MRQPVLKLRTIRKIAKCFFEMLRNKTDYKKKTPLNFGGVFLFYDAQTIRHVRHGTFLCTYI